MTCTLGHSNWSIASLQGGLLNFLVMSGLLFAIYTTPDNGKNHLNRLGYLLGFAFFSGKFGFCFSVLKFMFVGFGLGPLIELTLYVKPTILPTAFFSTAILFACFTLSSIYGDRRKALFLGGTLMSGLSLLLFMSVLNLFFNSILISKVISYFHIFLNFFSFSIYAHRHTSTWHFSSCVVSSSMIPRWLSKNELRATLITFRMFEFFTHNVFYSNRVPFLDMLFSSLWISSASSVICWWFSPKR